MRINHGALILVLLLSVLPFRTINNAQPTRRSGSSSSSPPPPPENNKSHAISNDADKRYKIVSLILGSLVLISFCVVGIILPCFYDSICSCVNKLCPRRNGLDQAVIETFPVFNYSAVQGLREESAPELVCAVCLNEFSDDETLRVLPCNHVFHPWCIDVWLAHSKTCPVCRAKHSRHDSESKPDVRVREPITDGSNQQAELNEGQGDAGTDVVVNVVNEEESGENCRDNYTSRLPEEVRRQLIPNS